MAVDYPEAFEEDAISVDEAMGASPRFIAFRNKGSYAFRLLTDDDAASSMVVTKDEILLLLSEALERGAQIEIAG